MLSQRLIKSHALITSERLIRYVSYGIFLRGLTDDTFKMDSMIKLFRNLSLSTLFLSLVGCATPPRTVDATIPLVNTTTFVSSESVSPRYWDALNNDSRTQFASQDYHVLLAPAYFSALGTRCRQLTFLLDDVPVGTRTACANSSSSTKSQWFLTKPLTNEQSLVSLK